MLLSSLARRALIPFGPVQKSRSAEPEVLATELGSLRVATLNRPGALNALNANMVSLLTQYLARWEKQDVVHGVVLKGAGGKAFCSGGDVKAAVLSCRGGSIAEAAAFFKAEYMLDYQISRMRTPVVSLMDGLTFGGGAGLAMSSHIRVATDRTLFAMPESAIGFFPDVGATHFLGRLPGHIGLCVALTGWRLTGREMYELRLATHYLPSEQMGAVEQALGDMAREIRRIPAQDVLNDILEIYCEDTDDCAGRSASDPAAISSVIAAHNLGITVGPLPPSSIALPRHLEMVDDCFGRPTVEEIAAALEAAAGGAGGGAEGQGGEGQGGEGATVGDAGEAGEAGEGRRLAAALLAELRKGSPTTLKVGLAAFKAQKGKRLRDALIADNRMAHRMLRGKDFHEGVRAMLIDKTKDPKWAPAALKDVSSTAAAAYLDPLPAGEELTLPHEPTPARM